MHSLTTADVCRILDVSEKSVQRYVKRGILHPKRTESGIVQNMFEVEEVEKVKQKFSELRTVRTEMSESPKPPRQQNGDLSQVVAVLQSQLEVKDRQLAEANERLKSEQERNRESNILLKQVQDRLLIGQTQTETGTDTRQEEGTETVTKDSRGQTDRVETDRTWDQKYLPTFSKMWRK